ncbi:MAG: endonuclease NucS domain-containing protein [Candidatus Hodarchaeales archaeon]
MNNNIVQLSRSLTILKDQLSDHIEKKMILILGNCSAFFDGRIKSRFTDGDRFLIIKKDLSIVLHGSSGVKPVQWQLAGAGKVSFRITDDHLRMETYRPKTDESFFIAFSEVYLALSYNALEFDETASIIGHEKDFVEYLVKNPNIIEQGIRVIETEKEIDAGFIDIWGMDTSNNFVVVEVKRTNATPADAHQLKRYVDFFQKQGDQVRGILVATGFPRKVKKYLKTFDLESCTVPWQDVFPTITRPSSTLQSKRLDEFFSKDCELLK